MMKRGEYNMTYYEELKKVVDLFEEFGIYTLLDSHQDVLNSKFCGEGIPDVRSPLIFILFIYIIYFLFFIYF